MWTLFNSGSKSFDVYLGIALILGPKLVEAEWWASCITV